MSNPYISIEKDERACVKDYYKLGMRNKVTCHPWKIVPSSSLNVSSFFSLVVTVFNHPLISGEKTKEPKKCFLLKPVPIVTNCKSSENWNKTFIRGRSRHSNVLKRFQSISWIRCRAMATSNSYLSHASQRILIHEGSLSLVIASKNATKFPTVSVYWRPKEAITCTSSERIGNTTQIHSLFH